MPRSAWLSLLLAAALPVLAASPAKAPAPQSSPVPLLWKVSDANNSVYLLGSFHLLRKDDYPLSKDIDAALTDAESVMFELPPEEMGSVELGQSMFVAAVRTDGTTLSDDLTPAMQKNYDKWVAAHDTDIRAMFGGAAGAELLQKMKPWMVGILVSLVDAKGMGMESELGLDMHLSAAAKAAGKPSSGLETGAQQLALFSGMSREEQLQLLDEALTESSDGKQEMESLHREWRAGNADALWNGMGKETRAKFPALYRRINVERNDAWVPKLEGLLRAPGTDDTLVVVGALHLLGNDGVVEKLRAKGFKVERICSACKH
ncbi:TraB/GumN family protein [Lysobacter helvus]|uniref:TraB/GumN family protein n=2 Tax=Lysobacteraceae TaxID=32033 RepID=A0ABN6FWQ8_9GAMM|nr:MULTISPECIES: TraB/GumN family protein [Lysobacter]BCT93374.1 TraB/GumN family protein [Lysobacter caseinilyticus]BCT96527.1 TraB/GumN family protein [Lysobacter helvus]